MENTPYMPVTHYTDGKFSQARFQCDLCHVPQADVTPLVKNGNDKFIVTKKKQ